MKPDVEPDLLAREEIAAVEHSSTALVFDSPMKEEYQDILRMSPELIRDQTFIYFIGGKKGTITPGLWVDGDNKDDGELYVSCTIKDEDGERTEKIMVRSFLEELFTGVLRPIDGVEAYAAKLLIYDSLRKQKRA